MKFRPIKEYYEQFLYAVYTIPEAAILTRRKRLWEGFWRYGWVSRLLIILAIIAGVKFFDLLFDWFGQVDTSNPASVASSVGSFFTDVAAEELEFLFSGGLKYAMLALMEILIFHITRRTYQILSGKDSDASFKAFLRAQVRMLKVTLRSYVLEMIIVALINAAISMMNFLSPLGWIAIVGVQAYYMGFTIIDNYFEQFHMTIRESIRESRRYLGIVLALGLILQLFFIIPVLGTIVGPLLATVAATMIMFELGEAHKRAALGHASHQSGKASLL